MSRKHVIRLINAVFYGFHGNMSEEQNLGGRYHVDVVLETDFSEAAADDSLSHTVDYGEVYALIQGILTEQNHRLIETIAAHVASHLLQRFETVRAVTVRVRKPGAPVRGIIDYVEAEVHEERAS
jgi:dihydroneopterin aldolase